MFSLTKLLTGDDATPPASHLPEAALQTGAGPALLCREAVFNRHDRLIGHLFRLHGSSLTADAPAPQQRQTDLRLLDILAASPPAWGTQTAFLPLASANLDAPAIERLPAKNLVLLIHLSLDDSAPETLELQVRHLHQLGLAIGLFHQPWHPAFARLRPLASYGICNIVAAGAEDIHDFPEVFAASGEPLPLFAANIDSLDEHRLCRQRHFDFFHGRFAATTPLPSRTTEVDPNKAQLLNLLRLVEGNAETPEIAEAMKQAPVLTFRVLRYLNSPAIGLNHRIDSLSQALIMLGRQRLSRWLSVLLFSVSGAGFADWLLAESALTRGRLMEELGPRLTPELPADPLFLTGVLSCLDRLLHQPLAAIIAELPLSEEIRSALLDKSGPFAPLLAIAEASEAGDHAGLAAASAAAGLSADDVNHALLAATAWASEVTADWE